MADAKLENLYTPAAYEYMKRLEFKSIAARFGEGIRNESGPEKQFVLVEDFSEADALFEKAKKEKRIGMELLAENGSVTALALSFEETGSYIFPVGGFMTESYIAGKYEELCRTGPCLGAGSQAFFAVCEAFLRGYRLRCGCRGVPFKSVKGHLWVR